MNNAHKPSFLRQATISEYLANGAEGDWSIEYRLDGVATDIDEHEHISWDAARVEAVMLDAANGVEEDDCRSYGYGLHTVALVLDGITTVAEVVTFDLRPVQLTLC